MFTFCQGRVKVVQRSIGHSADLAFIAENRCLSENTQNSKNMSKQQTNRVFDGDKVARI